MIYQEDFIINSKIVWLDPIFDYKLFSMYIYLYIIIFTETVFDISSGNIETPTDKKISSRTWVISFHIDLLVFFSLLYAHLKTNKQTVWNKQTNKKKKLP